MIQVGTFDEAVVDKKILVTPGLSGSFRFSDITANVHVIGIFCYTHQLGLIGIPQ